jgi:hypothetical protein
MHARITVPGIPLLYQPCAANSLARYIEDILDFLSSPVARSIALGHPNRLAIQLAVSPSSNAFNLGRVYGADMHSWWPYLETLGEQSFLHDGTVAEESKSSVDLLRYLVETRSVSVRALQSWILLDS